MNAILRLLLAGGLVLGLGCGGESDAAAPPPPQSPAAAAPAAGGAPPAAPAAPEGNVCEQAADCCTVYIEAMIARHPAMAGSMNAETTCAGVRQASASGASGNAACQAAIEGWREGLAALPNVTMPAACE